MTQTNLFDKAAGSRAGYDEWRRSEEGSGGYDHLLTWADQLRADGRPRISVNALCERLRLERGMHVNNTWRAWIADDLIAVRPALAGLIERRRRRKP